MGIIDLELTVSSLLGYAKTAMDKKQWYLAAQNLNDAFDRAETEEEKKKVYLSYADLFMCAGNFPLARYAFFMAAREDYKGGYSYFDFVRFLPDPTYTVPVEEEEERITSEQTLAFNRVYTLICERKYAEAIKLFYTLPFNRKNMTSIVDALSVALNSDTKFDLDSYIVPLLPIIGEYASGDAEFINILLTGGDNTRMLAVEGAKFFIDDNEDVDLLRDMGEVFFVASEFETAKSFFEKVLSLCEIDEVALYYMYALSLALKDLESAKKYRAKYLTVCRFAIPPMRLIDLCATLTKKNSAQEYLTLPSGRERELYAELETLETIDESNFIRIKDFCTFGNPYLTVSLLSKFAKNKDKEKFFLLCNTLMESSFVGKDNKAEILALAIENGFEGILTYNYPNKGVICEVAALHHRYGLWNVIYNKVTDLIIGADFYLPYHSNVLAGVIKRCKENIVFPQSEDMDFFLFCAMISYANRLTENVSLSDVAGLVALTPGSLDNCLAKYALESPIV